VDRLDPRAEHHGDVRGVDEHQRDRAEDDGVGRDPLQPQPRQPEPDEVERDDQRDPAEQVDIPGRERADGKEHRATQGAQRRDEQPDDEDPHVEPQPVEHRRERTHYYVEIEERVPHPGPAR
jgi:hypothetical protein